MRFWISSASRTSFASWSRISLRCRRWTASRLERAVSIRPTSWADLRGSRPFSADSWRTEEGQASAKTEQMKADSAAFSDMARKYGVTEAQFLLRWGVQNGYAVLPKSLNPQRMKQNIDLEGFEIDDTDMAAIREMDRGQGVAWATGDPSSAD